MDKKIKEELICKLKQVKELYVKAEDYNNANLIKQKIEELENGGDTFNFSGNTGQINIGSGTSKINCVQNNVRTTIL